MNLLILFFLLKLQRGCMNSWIQRVKCTRPIRSVHVAFFSIYRVNKVVVFFRISKFEIVIPKNVIDGGIYFKTEITRSLKLLLAIVRRSVF